MREESTDRIIGRLEAQHKEVSRRLDSIEEVLKSLQAFRWKALGASGLVAFVISLVVEIARTSH